MASLKSMKYDINKLKEIFTKDHERFRVIKTSSDQLTCLFIGENGTENKIEAMIPDSYPTGSIIWYTDMNEKGITSIVEKLSETNENKSILDQINILLRDLCQLYNVELPIEAMALLGGESSSSGSVEDLGTCDQNESIEPNLNDISATDVIECEADEMDDNLFNCFIKGDETGREPSLKSPSQKPKGETKSLKYDISALKEIFTNTHKRFQILKTTVDEITCQFIGRNDKKYEIHAVIPDSYPLGPVFWYSNSDESGITNIVEKLSEENENKSISDQINILLSDLCDLHKLDLPNEVSVLKRSYQNVENSGSSQSTSRLMKELNEIYRSDSFKNCDYFIQLVDDSIYEWDIHLRSFDRDSQLFKHLLKLKETEGIDSVHLKMTFTDKYPIEPPFVRVVYPRLMCQHIVDGGAICTALLLKEHWSPAYTVESVIVHLAALFVEGNARIDFLEKTKYNLRDAQKGFGFVISLQKDGYFKRKESS